MVGCLLVKVQLFFQVLTFLGTCTLTCISFLPMLISLFFCCSSFTPFLLNASYPFFLLFSYDAILPLLWCFHSSPFCCPPFPSSWCSIFPFSSHALIPIILIPCFPFLLMFSFPFLLMLSFPILLIPSFPFLLMLFLHFFLMLSFLFLLILPWSQQFPLSLPSPFHHFYLQAERGEIPLRL